MVERFHRQLKSSLLSSNRQQYWYEVLPIALLGLRSTFKEDLKSTPAEMVYGQHLRLPGEIVVSNAKDSNFDFLTNLKEYFKNVRSGLSHHKGYNGGYYVPKDLSSCKYVLLRVEQKRAMQQPYEGPYEVIKKDEKFFKLKIHDTVKTVSIDRLKPAYFEGSDDNGQKEEKTSYL